MGRNVNYILDDSLHTVKNLLDLLEQDEADMAHCVTGEILQEYRKATSMAREKVLKIKRRLLQLQEAESLRSEM